MDKPYKMHKQVWLFYMGFVDSWDYSIGHQPELPDDGVPIKLRAKAFKNMWDNRDE